VSYSLTGSTAAAADYQEALGGSVTFAAGQDRVTLTVTPVDDSLPEGTETLVVTVTAGGNYTPGGAASATLALLDNDRVLGVAASTPTAAEGDRAHPAVFTLTRQGDLTQPLTVAYQPGGTASADDYYEGLSGSVTLDAGQASATLRLTPIDDAEFEGSETVTLTLLSRPGYTLGAAPSATVTLRDNDRRV